VVKKRLDKILQARYPSVSRSKMQELIAHGAVTVDGQVITQASLLIPEDSAIQVDFSALKYVSRAGFKLEHALQAFNVSVKDLVCLDAGLSTGGFTDCLLQHGARKVYGIDVGTAQIHPKIACDPRVIVMENTDIRAVPVLADIIDCMTLDLSFISLTKIIAEAAHLLKSGGTLITLIKPQFEVGLQIAQRYQGVIKDADIQQEAVATVTQAIKNAGFELISVTESPILGGSGNKEFLAYFIKKNLADVCS